MCFRVNPNTLKIGQLKTMIKERFNIKQKDQGIIFAGRLIGVKMVGGMTVAKDENFLASYNIQNNNSLHFFTRLKGETC